MTVVTTQLKRANLARARDAKLGVSHRVRQPGYQYTPRKVRTMKHGAITRGALGMTVALALFGICGASAASAATTTCTDPPLTQPFLSFGDSNWYSLTGGESYDSFNGSGWTLSRGASLVNTTLYDGTSGSVLDLPYGAQAISPPTCVNNLYPYLRTMVRSYGG